MRNCTCARAVSRSCSIQQYTVKSADSSWRAERSSGQQVNAAGEASVGGLVTPAAQLRNNFSSFTSSPCSTSPSITAVTWSSTQLTTQSTTLPTKFKPPYSAMHTFLLSSTCAAQAQTALQPRANSSHSNTIHAQMFSKPAHCNSNMLTGWFQHSPNTSLQAVPTIQAPSTTSTPSAIPPPHSNNCLHSTPHKTSTAVPRRSYPAHPICLPHYASPTSITSADPTIPVAINPSLPLTTSSYHLILPPQHHSSAHILSRNQTSPSTAPHFQVGVAAPRPAAPLPPMGVDAPPAAALQRQLSVPVPPVTSPHMLPTSYPTIASAGRCSRSYRPSHSTTTGCASTPQPPHSFQPTCMAGAGHPTRALPTFMHGQSGLNRPLSSITSTSCQHTSSIAVQLDMDANAADIPPATSQLPSPLANNIRDAGVNAVAHSTSPVPSTQASPVQDTESNLQTHTTTSQLPSVDPGTPRRQTIAQLLDEPVEYTPHWPSSPAAVEPTVQQLQQLQEPATQVEQEQHDPVIQDSTNTSLGTSLQLEQEQLDPVMHNSTDSHSSQQSEQELRRPRNPPVSMDYSSATESWPGPFPPSHTLSLISKHAADFVRLCQGSTEARNPMMTLLFHRIARAAARTLPPQTRLRARLNLFGSSATGLGLPGSDFDFVLTSVVNPGADGDLTTKQQKQVVKVLRGVEHELCVDEVMAPVLGKFTLVSSARVPVLQFTLIGDACSTDLTVHNTNGVLAGNLVRNHLKTFPGAVAVVLVVKALLSGAGMNKVYHGGLGGYAVTCMAIAHFQEQRKRDPKYLNDLGFMLVTFLQRYGSNGMLNTVANVSRGGVLGMKKARKLERNFHSSGSCWEGNMMYHVACMVTGKNVTANSHLAPKIRCLFDEAAQQLASIQLGADGTLPKYCGGNILNALFDMRKLQAVAQQSVLQVDEESLEYQEAESFLYRMSVDETAGLFLALPDLPTRVDSGRKSRGEQGAGKGGKMKGKSSGKSKSRADLDAGVVAQGPDDPGATAQKKKKKKKKGEKGGESVGESRESKDGVELIASRGQVGRDVGKLEGVEQEGVQVLAAKRTSVDSEEGDDLVFLSDFDPENVQVEGGEGGGLQGGAKRKLLGRRGLILQRKLERLTKVKS